MATVRYFTFVAETKQLTESKEMPAAIPSPVQDQIRKLIADLDTNAKVFIYLCTSGNNSWVEIANVEESVEELAKHRVPQVVHVEITTHSVSLASLAALDALSCVSTKSTFFKCLLCTKIYCPMNPRS